MDDQALKSLCLSLIKADTEDEVIQLLSKAGYWENTNYWRYYGDNENNFGIIGAQQRFPDAAIVEKLVNSVDAKLMSECIRKGIGPEGKNAPRDIRAAVAYFFENDTNPNHLSRGVISEWSDQKRNEVAQGINLSATGNMPKEGQPCFTISDNGEGQTPMKMPETLLSLAKSNKIKIPFVQGQFNQGGSGVLRFCGDRIQQLVVSKRIPEALKQCEVTDPSDSDWGFTVVRREEPTGGRKNSVYTFLAPLGDGSEKRQGEVLHFSSEHLPIFSNGNNAYALESEWGTLIKLYEYQNGKFGRSNILLTGGLQTRMDLLLPYIALPVRAHECRRGFKGRRGSFANNINGLSVRLHDARQDNTENDWSASMNIDGETIHVRIFVFKAGRQKAYKNNEGIIFSSNGQTQGILTNDFFIRRKVKRGYLKNSLLVIVDCSEISFRAREKLFMNSRDRISGNDFAKKLEVELEDLLRNHAGLKELEEKRRREEAANKLEDDKPLEEALENILKNSPALANLFLKGVRASNPFKTDKVAKQDEFKGKQYPTYFKFKSLDTGVILKKECPINSKTRIEFETDADNDYFDRKSDPGSNDLLIISGHKSSSTENYSGPNLHNGIASLNVQIPEDATIGNELHYRLLINDSSRIESIINDFVITVQYPVEKNPEGGKGRRKSPSKKKGEDREHAAGIAMPNIDQVSETEWEKQDPPFDKYTSLRVIEAGGDNGYDFKVNIDNIYLKSELKSGKSVEHDLARYRFIYGMVLIGLALLKEDKSKTERKASSFESNDSLNGENVFDSIENSSRAIAPVLLPMINSLADLDVGDNQDAIGEEI